MKIVNEKFRIAIASIQEIPKTYADFMQQDGQQLKDMTFFFYQEENLIVVNEEHKDFDLYLELVQAYMELTAESQKRVQDEVPCAEILHMLKILDMINNLRTAGGTK